MDAIQSDNDHGIVDMFCGTGKSLIMAKLSSTKTKAVLFFPSIALVYQFYRQYADEVSEFQNQLVVCSSDEVDKAEDEPEAHSHIATTDENLIKRKLNGLSVGSKLLVLCTYHSSKLLLSCMEGIEITFELALFDEAHNVISKDFLWEPDVVDSMHFRRRIYFSATVPAQLSAEYPTLYRLSCSDAIDKGLVRDYEIVCPLYGRGSNEVFPEDSPERQKLLIECIAKAISDYRRSRVILFHRFSQKSIKNSASSVEMYHENEQLFVDSVKQFCGQKTAVHVHSITAATKNRDEIFESFKRSDNSIQVLSNCQVLKEGVDLPNADMAVLVDRKESFNQIVQNIGRTLRKTTDDTVAVIFVPVYVDGFKILDDTNTTIENAISEHRFDKIMQVLAALKEQDPRILAAVQDACKAVKSNPNTDKVVVSLETEVLQKDDDDSQSEKPLQPKKPKLVLSENIRVYWGIDEYDEIDELDLLNSIIVRELVIKEQNTITLEDKIKAVGDFVMLKKRLPWASGPGLKPEESRLGRWCMKWRTEKQQGLLPDNEMKLIQNIPMWSWNNDDSDFEKYYLMVVEFYQNGDLPKLYDFNSDDEGVLSLWVALQRRLNKLGKLSNYRIERLSDLCHDILEETKSEFEEMRKIWYTFNLVKGKCSRQLFLRWSRVLKSWKEEKCKLYSSKTLPHDELTALENTPGWSWDLEKVSKSKTTSRKKASNDFVLTSKLDMLVNEDTPEKVQSELNNGEKLETSNNELN